MLKPLHFCSWSHDKHTLLRYKNGGFGSAGTSLSVLWDALKEEGLHWFSREYGEVHQGQAENLVVLTPSVTTRSARQPGPLTERLRQTGIRESFLSDAVCMQLNVGGEEQRFIVHDDSRARCAAYFHDDCFASVRPVDQTLLLHLVHATLKLHSYYFGKEILWFPVLEPLTQLLVATSEFELISDIDSGTVFVDHPYQTSRRQRGEYVKPYIARMDIVGATASLKLLQAPESNPCKAQ